MSLLNGNRSEQVISECGGFIRLNQQLIRISNIQSGSAKKRIGSKWINEFGQFAATFLELAFFPPLSLYVYIYIYIYIYVYISVAANSPNSFIHFDPILFLADPDWILLIRINCWFSRINPPHFGITSSDPFPINKDIEQTPRHSVS